MKYIKTPKTIKLNEVIDNNSSFSASQYKKLVIDYNRSKKLKWFLKEELSNDHKGSEIGSENYYKESTHYFVRTSCLESYNFTIEFTDESQIPMNPKVFIGEGLKYGDIILSKDSNIGECVMVDGDYPNHMLSGAMYNLPIKDKYKFYLLALLKHDYFKEQLDILVPKGATIRHAKTLFLDCYIPVPDERELFEISNISKMIFEKEILIKQRFNNTLNFIKNELDENQKNQEYQFEFPKFEELLDKKRFDTGLYNEIYKRTIHLIENYKYGYSNITDKGLTLKRGQNLQVSQIGKSIYSDDYYASFYTLILPKYLSKYGTVNMKSYLGNENNLQKLEKGDIIFGAEGFGKGRSIVVISDMEKTITNIHGITIKQEKEHDLKKGIFVKQILDFYRDDGIIDMMAVGGNGGSFAQKYWDVLKFPNFPKDKIDKVTKYYHNEELGVYNIKSEIDKDFILYDSIYNKNAGIHDLDLSIKMLKKELRKKIDKMITK